MATKEHAPLSDEGLEIVYSVTLQEAIQAVGQAKADLSELGVQVLDTGVNAHASLVHGGRETP